MSGHRSGRWIVVLAALLWSLSGLFITMLTQPIEWLGSLPPVPAEQIACWRCLFGAASQCVLLRRSMVRWHPFMPVMAGCFALMNALFVLAMSLGDVAEAALLQYTAPLWVFLVNILLRRAIPTHRDKVTLSIAVIGIGIIVLGRYQASHAYASLLSLGAGVAFAGVLLSLSWLSNYSSIWLAIMNQLAAGLLALPWALSTPWPQGIQWIILFIFGAIQVALPYWLMSYAMKSVPAHEAALITLLDPLLAPVWVYFILGTIPSTTTWLGGTVFFIALVIRYAPLRWAAASTKQDN